MLSTSACVASGMANTDDGTCWETVLRYFETPTPAQYSFEFDARIEEEGQPFEENLLVDEYLFKQQPHCVPRQTIHSKNQKLEWKPVVDAKSDCKHINPAKFLKLTEIEMVQSLRRWKQVAQESVAHPVTIKEADVYALHPADLIKGACTHYFYSATKYSCLKRPTRLRITENGCRWKQQGRIFPIRENGQTVAYKTYLSYVALKNGNNIPKKLPGASVANIDPSPSKDMVCKRRDRKWSLWTMEEIGLAEDIQSERVVLRRGGRPRPFPVICRIVCKRDGHTSPPLQARIKCKKPPFRSKDSQAAVAEPKPRDTDISPAAAPISTVPMLSEVSCFAGSTNIQVSCLPGSTSASLPNAQDILEDEIIRALIYDLPYGKIRTAATAC
ncbi:unnamed protein product [Calypogeia fissa]